MAGLGEKRGPKIGDASSLWNNTLSPGWTIEEVGILKKALMKFGIGKWKEIVDSGCLPGKMIQQLSTQTQRMLGQQSTKVFTGLRLDVDKIRAHNDAKQDVHRKNGLIINSGGIKSKEETDAMRAESQKTFGLDQAFIDSIVLDYADARDGVEAYGGCKSKEISSRGKNKGDIKPKLEQPKGKLSASARRRAAAKIVSQLLDTNPLEVDVSVLSRPAKLVLLKHLHSEMGSLANKLQEGSPPPHQAIKEATNIQREEPVDEETISKPVPKAKPAAKKRGRESSGQGRKAKRSTPAYTEDPDDGDDGDNDSPMIEQLVQMGFTKKKAGDALLECGGNLESAVEWLFMNT